MESITTILLILVVVLAGSYVLFAEFLDTIGRLEIVEKRWPKVWVALNNRPLRVFLLILLIGLVAKDIAERIKDTGPAPLVVNMPSIPPPTIIQSQPQPDTMVRLSLSQSPLKPTATAPSAAPQSRPGVFAIVTMKTPFNEPAFRAKCTVPCELISAMSIGTATKANTSGIGHDLMTTETVFEIPGRIDVAGQVGLEFRSRDDRPVSLTWVKPIQR